MNYPAPLTPIECDLRDFAFMPLDVQRLRDSELATLESPEACWAAVLLWCVSWHQVPAASLPNDERMLASFAGYFNRGKVDKAWNSVREGAMRNWLLCSDNRYYHPVVADKALSAWRSKWEQAYRTELARIKKHNQRHEDNQLENPTFEQFVSTRTSPDCPVDITHMSRGQDANVPGKSHPTDTDTEGILKGYIKPSVLDTQSSNPTEPSARLTPGLASKILREAGIQDGNPAHPTLIALVDSGATEYEFRQAGIEAATKRKGFNYAIGIVKGRREDAANLKLHQGAMPSGPPSKHDARAEVARGIWGDKQQQGEGQHGRTIEHEATGTDEGHRAIIPAP